MSCDYSSLIFEMQGGNNCVPKHLNMEVQKMKVFFLNCHIHSKAHPSPSASKDEAHVLLPYIIKWQTHGTTDITGKLPIKWDFGCWAPASLSRRKASIWATSKLCLYSRCQGWISDHLCGMRVGMARNSKLGSLISFLARQRKGFSKF